MNIDLTEPNRIWHGVETVCTEHDPMDPACSTCNGEKLARQTVLAKIAESGQGILTDITMAGVKLPETLLLAIRVDTALNAIFSQERDRLLFEGEVARRTHLTLEDMLAQVKEMQAAEQSASSQLILPDEKKIVVDGGAQVPTV